MQVPAHGGDVYITLLSKRIPHIQHWDVFSLQVGKSFKWRFHTFHLRAPGPVFNPFPVDAIHVIHNPQAVNIIFRSEVFNLGDNVLGRTNPEFRTVDGILAPLAVKGTAAPQADCEGSVPVMFAPVLKVTIHINHIPRWLGKAVKIKDIWAPWVDLYLPIRGAIGNSNDI
jgi:hypothetical protein